MVAINDRWVGAACKTQEVGGLGVDVGTDTGVGVPAPGVVVPAPGVVVPAPGVVVPAAGVGVPAPGVVVPGELELVPVPLPVPLTGEKTTLVPLMAAMSVSDRV